MVSGGVVSLVFSAKLIFCTESGRSLADGDRAAELLARLTVEILIIITNQLGWNNILKSCSHTQILYK